MSRLNLQRMMCGLVVLIGLAGFGVGGWAADPPAPKGQPGKEDQGAGNKRLIYLVKHGSAKDLAAVLSEHFKGVAEIQALPDAATNCLLISTSPTAFEEIVKVLDQLDHRPQIASVEIFIAEVAQKKGEGDKPAPAEEVDEKDFTGTLADVEAKVDALQKKGALASLKRIQLTAVEGLPVSMMLGENRPFVAGTNMTATGHVSRAITYRNAGIKVDATVHISPDKTVTVDLKLEDAHPYTPENGIPIGTDENGKPIQATEFAVTSLSGKLEIPSGQAQAAQDVKTVAKSDRTHTVIIVGARVQAPDAKAEK
jgi:type II secretory pathway component GspD/PulD (secretin)